MTSEVALQLSLAQKSKEQKSIGQTNSPAKRGKHRAVSGKASNSKIMVTNNLPVFDKSVFDRTANDFQNISGKSLLSKLYLYFTEKGRNYSLEIAKMSAARQFDLKEQDTVSIPNMETMVDQYPSCECNAFADAVLDALLKNGIFEVSYDGSRRAIGPLLPTSSRETLDVLRAVAQDKSVSIAKRIEFLAAVSQEANTLLTSLATEHQTDIS